MNTNRFHNVRPATCLATLLFSAVATFGFAGSPAYAAPITVTIAGKVTDANNNAKGGVTVKGRLSNGAGAGNAVTGTSVASWQTNVQGNYTSPPPMRGNAGAAATLNYTVWTKTPTNTQLAVPTGGTVAVFNRNLPILKDTVTYSSGQASGAVTLAAGAGAVANANIVVNPKTFTTTYSQLGPINAIGSIDPTYSFTPSGANSGTITFSDSFNPSISTALFEGFARYSDGSMATDNNSLESIFDQSVQIGSISVLGRNPDGSFNFGNSTIQIGDPSSGIYLQGNTVNLYGEDGPNGQALGGFLNITQLGGSNLNSELINDFSSLQAEGATFQIGFDPTFLTATNDFTTSAAQNGSVDIVASNAAPEPAALFLMGGGLLGLGVFRRVPRRRDRCARVPQ